MPMLRYAWSCVFAILLAVLIGACSGPTQLSTGSMAQRPAVDGSIEEWSGRITTVEDPSVSLAAFPTDSLLYVAVLVQDRGLVRSIAVNGLVLWVDPSGGQRRRYGVQYPLGIRRQRAGQAGATDPTSAPSGLDDVSLTELEVVRGDTARRRIPARFSAGLRGSARLDPASLVCELAIPVGPAPTSPDSTAQWHGIATALGTTVGVGLEIPKPEEDAEFSPQGTGIGSVTGRGGRRRRGRRRPRRRQQQSAPELPSLDLWTTIATAEGSQ